MAFQDFEKCREGIRLGCDRQMIVNEIISEIVEATNKIFNDHLEKHDISTTSIRSDEIMSDVRKWLYDDLKPLVEPKMKEETIMVCDKDHDYFGLDCSITVDRVVHTYGGRPEYQFSGATNDIDELTRRIKVRSDSPEFLIKKFDVGTLARHPSLIANRIWQNDGRHTTVEWRDGTKTTVCCEDPEKYTEWGGFCACVVKKLYGSATKAELELQTAKETTAWPAKKKQMEREKIKKMCRERHDRAVMEREEKIAAKMEEMWITNEAGHRLAKEYSKKETAVAAEEG